MTTTDFRSDTDTLRSEVVLLSRKGKRRRGAAWDPLCRRPLDLPTV